MRSYENKLSVVPPMAEVELTVRGHVIRGAFTELWKPQKRPSSLSDGGHQCKHGFMNQKEGVGKTGKPYEGYVCPETDRNQQCKPVWL
jgi:hypothetical protein